MIERKDFPVGRRGYNPAAVDSHLRAIAEGVEELQRLVSLHTEKLAAVGSDEVQAMIEAAERNAAEIHRRAEEEARAIRDAATRDAKREREAVLRQSREYAGKVSEASSQMRSRLEAMESELGALTETLRGGANRLTAELEMLESGVSDLSVAASAPPRRGPSDAVETALPGAGELEPEPSLAAAEPEPQAILAARPSDEPKPQAIPAARPSDEPEPQAIPAARPSDEPEPAASSALLEEPIGAEAVPRAADRDRASLATDGDAPAGQKGDDTDGARLIALNMALNGTPRQETDRYLAENFELPDRRQLLDDVYASVEG